MRKESLLFYVAGRYEVVVKKLGTFAVSCICFLFFPSAWARSADMVSAADHNFAATMSKDGSYTLKVLATGWQLEGQFPAKVSRLKKSSGQDAIGAYSEVRAVYGDDKREADIRVYEQQPVVQFMDKRVKAGANDAAFPAFAAIPSGLQQLSFKRDSFAHYEFHQLTDQGPWLLFDSQNRSLLLSSADHFLVSGLTRTASGGFQSAIESSITNLPAKFTHSTLVAYADGENEAFSRWGSALLALGGKQAPANDADILLNKLGYWTDNGAKYYYKFDPKLGYTGTLLAVRDAYRKLGVPMGYMQIDSWWYPKGPNGAWRGNQNGVHGAQDGEMEYRAAKELFPQGLAAFDKSLGVPLATHARWIATASPYRQQYKMSGNVVIDPKFWSSTAEYLQKSGVVTYEQDWLNKNAQTDANLTDPQKFLGEMSKAMAAHHITIQYCMPLPGHFLASTRYQNVTTIRTSDDHFGRSRWDSFLYTSQLARAVGLWPWVDIFYSKEQGNLVIATLSSGPVGTGDAMDDIHSLNLLSAIRTDGDIVKPDTSLLPINAMYLRDAKDSTSPMVATASTDFGGLTEKYVFAYPRAKEDAGTTVTLAELGVQGKAYAYDWVSNQGHLVPANGKLRMTFRNGWAYQVVVPVGKSGIAFLGDTGQITPLGRKRISSLTDDGAVHVTVQFATGETDRTVTAYAPQKPTIKAVHGSVEDEHYDAATGVFSAKVRPDKAHEAVVTISPAA
ncbi:MAG: hypothetical protein ACYC46_03320 [Acidobacteriaceae bacterium]